MTSTETRFESEITIPTRRTHFEVDPERDRLQLRAILPLVKSNLSLEPLLQKPEWYEKRTETIEGGRNIEVDNTPITGLMLLSVYTNPLRAWDIYRKVRAARVNYKPGDKETLNDTIDPRRVNVTTPLVTLSSAVLGYGYMSADNPFVERAEELLKERGTCMADLRVKNMQDEIVMPGQGLYGQGARRVLGDNYETVANDVFDLKAIFAAKKIIGRGSGELTRGNTLAREEIELIFGMADLAMAVMAWTDASGMFRPLMKLGVERKLSTVSPPDNFANYESMDLYRLNAFIGSRLYEDVVGRIGN